MKFKIEKLHSMRLISVNGVTILITDSRCYAEAVEVTGKMKTKLRY
jgi:hypothetical protein